MSNNARRPAMWRFGAGLLLAPLVPFVVYTLFFYALTSLTGNAKGGMAVGAFFAVIVAFAYAVTLVIWLPLILWLESRQLRSPRHYVLTGALVFLVTVLVYYLWSAGASAIAEGWLLAFIAALIGALYGIAYWAATYWTPARAAA